MDRDGMRGDGMHSVEDEDSQCSAYHSMNRDCCAPQTFTSVLLGILACVLVTGGVFLAFHKWDYTWLLVSGVGILLMAIGTALHCCSSDIDAGRKHHRCTKLSCGTSRSKPDALSSGTGTMLTEQLLPLSNARSVSQLSLNMVPGYFPPLVYPAPGSPYGLEQHSTVVQNISKLVQHQQQLHLQSPTSNQSDSKSFILFPLPVDTNATNIQNIVAAVCQLDSCTRETAESQSANPPESVATIPRETNSSSISDHVTSSSVPPVLKHVEVQTCNDWDGHLQTKTLTTDASTDTASVLPGQTTSQVNIICQMIQRTEVEAVAVGESNVCEESNRDELIVAPTNSVDGEQVNQPDTICDNDIPTTSQVEDIPNTFQVEDIPNTFQVEDILVCPQVEDSLTTFQVEEIPLSPQVLDIPLSLPVNIEQLENVPSTSDTLCDPPSRQVGCNVTVVEEAQSVAEVVQTCAIEEETSIVEVEESIDIDEMSESLADISSDLESEVLERSSPPPSYDDATQEGVSHAPFSAFGLAYGTM